MIEIDGAYGEGGGQILRTAVALSVLTQQPIHITNIRAKRPTPGLRPQHYTALSCIKAMCGAEVTGLSVHSTDLTFTPHDITPGSYHFDIGTAGSTTLVFQACLLSVLHASAPVTVTLRGGTDVRWAPSWDYFTHVFLSLLHTIGVTTTVQLLKRGYYPTGGGEATLTIHPLKKLSLLNAGEPQHFHEISGIIHRANLPEHISTRMKHAAIQAAVKHNLRCTIHVDASQSSSPGTGITVWSASNSALLGAAVLGEKNVTAETVGQKAITYLITDVMSGATVDRFAVDQLLPYLVVAPKGSTVLIRELSNHAQTNMWLVKHFFDVDFEITRQQDVIRLTVA